MAYRKHLHLGSYYSAESQGVRKSDFYSETKVCRVFVLLYYCKATDRGFHTKPRIWFILFKNDKIATFIGYLD